MSNTKRSGSYAVRELEVWQRAMTAAEAVYRVTGNFPREERFGLTAQCRRAAVSIVANIAEGHGRRSIAAFTQFLRIAQGSTLELDTEMELATRLGYLSADAWSSLHDTLDHISRQITNLSKSLQKRRPLRDSNPGTNA